MTFLKVIFVFIPEFYHFRAYHLKDGMFNFNLARVVYFVFGKDIFIKSFIKILLLNHLYFKQAMSLYKQLI